MGNEVGTILIIIILILAIVIGPLLLIWSINTLWHTSTPYGGWEWLAGAVFIGLLAGSCHCASKKSN